MVPIRKMKVVIGAKGSQRKRLIVTHALNVAALEFVAITLG